MFTLTSWKLPRAVVMAAFVVAGASVLSVSGTGPAMALCTYGNPQCIGQPLKATAGQPEAKASQPEATASQPEATDDQPSATGDQPTTRVTRARPQRVQFRPERVSR